MSILVFKISMETVIKLFTFPLTDFFYRNSLFILRLEALTLIFYCLAPIVSSLFSSLSFFFFFCLLFAHTVTMVKTRGGGSSKKRVANFKATFFASKQQQQEASLYLPLAKPPVASSIATEATKPFPLPIPKGMRQKAQAPKPTKDLFESTSLEMLPSRPISPLSKSPLSSPSKTMGSLFGVTSGAPATPAKQLAQQHPLM